MSSFPHATSVGSFPKTATAQPQPQPQPHNHIHIRTIMAHRTLFQAEMPCTAPGATQAAAQAPPLPASEAPSAPGLMEQPAPNGITPSKHKNTEFVPGVFLAFDPDAQAYPVVGDAIAKLGCEAPVSGRRAKTGGEIGRAHV